MNVFESKSKPMAERSREANMPPILNRENDGIDLSHGSGRKKCKEGIDGID
jgi:hypothetical protein